MFGDVDLVEEELHIAIWSTPTKRTFFYKTTEKAAERSVALAEKGDNAYFGCGLLGKLPKNKRSRGKASDVRAITSFWADLDYQKGNAPPTQKDARKLASEIGIEPSIVLHSGHGLQCFWLIEPWIFDEDEVDHVGSVTSGWVSTLQQLAKNHGWAVDSVGDVSRVLRVPGTINFKNKNKPMPVKILEGKDGTV